MDDIKGSPKLLIFLNTEIRADYPYLYIYGRLEDARSICAKTKFFYHYFYVFLGNDQFPNDLDSRIHEAINFGKFDNGKYIHAIERVFRTTIMGYQPNGAIPMYKITMISYRHVSICQRMFESMGYLTYEASIKYEDRFMADMRFGGFDWLSLSDWEEVGNPESHCELEIEFHPNYLSKLAGNRSDFGQVRVLSFDIEACKGGNGRGFVNASEDSVSQIGNTLFDGNEIALDRRVFSLVPIGKGVTSLESKRIAVEYFEDERHVLLAWRNYVIKRDPDIITGYNIKLFDFVYLFERAKALGIYDEFVLLGKLIQKKSTIRKASFNSAAKGARLDYNVSIDGRFDFDMLKSIKEQFDLKYLRSHSLGNVAKHVLGYDKVEMPYHQIPAFQAGTDDQRAHLCYYCWWDAELCYLLMKKRMTLVNYIESARVCGTMMKYFLDRGQQVHTTRLLLEYGNARGFVVPSSTESQNDEDTKGATVKDPKMGLYVDPVVTLDFQSLYPSIIQALNICYSTKCGIKYAMEQLKDENYIVPHNTSGEYAFVAPHIMEGILPQMEKTLFQKRVEAKAQMNGTKEPGVKAVYNCKQNAIKTRMNSIYGYTKANTVSDKDLMEAVTGEGRDMLDVCTNIVHKNFPGSTVVYGDSVTGDTPCLLMDRFGRITVKTIESIGSEWIFSAGGKEYSWGCGYSVWTERGWTLIKWVMRHLTDKPIVRVSTSTGIIDCTEDHGLVRTTGERVASKELKIGDSLLHSFPKGWNGNVVVSEEHAIECARNAISPPDEILNASPRIRQIFADHFTEFSFIEKIDAMRTFALFKSIGRNVHVANHFGGMYYLEDKISISVKDILIESIESIDLPNDQYVYDLETENHHFHAGVGQMIVHNTDSLFIHFGKVSVERAFELGQQAADMCTAHFTQVDGGRKIRKLEREKAFQPFLLLGKKKYAGFKSLGPGKEFKRDETGLENVRKDNALIASETVDKVLELIIEGKDYTAKQAIQYVHRVIHELLMGRIPLSKLIISKNLSKTFKQYEEKGTKQPHVELAKKIALRSPQTGEQLYYTGDRVPYVMLVGPKDSPTAFNAEDPLFALNNRSPIDYRYYIDNQLVRPLLRILTPVLAPGESMKKWVVPKLKKGLMEQDMKPVKKDLNDEELKGLTAYKALFVGSHMMSTVRKVQIGGDIGLMKSLVKYESCLNCKCKIAPKKRELGAILPVEKSSQVCKSCEPKKSLIHVKFQMELMHLEDKKWKTWTQCQRCDKNLHGEVNCANRDCPNFYDRHKVILDLEDLTEKMEKL